MNKLKRHWKKIVTSLLTVLGIGTLTSCYGCPDEEPYYEDLDWDDVQPRDIYGRVTGLSDSSDEEIIEGIKVEFIQDDNVLCTAYTDQYGEFYISPYDFNHDIVYDAHFDSAASELRFTDVDGDASGSWKTVTKKPKKDYSGDYICNVLLSKND